MILLQSLLPPWRSGFVSCAAGPPTATCKPPALPPALKANRVFLLVTGCWLKPLTTPLLIAWNRSPSAHPGSIKDTHHASSYLPPKPPRCLPPCPQRHPCKQQPCSHAVHTTSPAHPCVQPRIPSTLHTNHRFVDRRNAVSGFSALSYASWSGSEATVRLLLGHGANPQVANEQPHDPVS